MTWVLDRGKYVNLDTAVIGEVVESHGVRAVRLRDARDNVIATVLEAALAPPNVVIAGPTAGVYISDTGEASWAAIVAWRLHHTGGAEPVLLGDRPQGTLFLPQGDALFGMGQLFKDLKSAVAAVVAAASTHEVEAAQ